jgi:hypothetical protein
MTASIDVQTAFGKILMNINSKAAMQRLGIYVIAAIRRRTRGQGKGVATPGGSEQKLKKVSDKYAKWRLKQPRHPEAAKGKASNLTQTGKMLDALQIKSATRTQLFIGFRNQHETDKAGWVQDAGRPFMFLSGKEIKDAAAYVKSSLKRT